MKICSNCGTDYEPYGQRSSLCKLCRRAYDREYHKNRSKKVKRHKQDLQNLRYVENKKRILNYLSKCSCELCGESDPIVLEFDHKSQDDKDSNVSEMCCFSWERIKKEIDKCRVLCCNCHRRHTARQLGWYKYL